MVEEYDPDGFPNQNSQEETMNNSSSRMSRPPHGGDL